MITDDAEGEVPVIEQLPERPVARQLSFVTCHDGHSVPR
jgi:hypothetical protein